MLREREHKEQNPEKQNGMKKSQPQKNNTKGTNKSQHSSHRDCKMD